MSNILLKNLLYSNIEYSKFPVLDSEETYKTISPNLNRFVILDHFSGFNNNYQNQFLEQLNGAPAIAVFDQIIIDNIKDRYRNVRFLFDANLHNEFYLKDKVGLSKLVSKRRKIDFKNFLACFNKSGHVGRQLLTSALFKLNMWSPEYCTKYFTNTIDQIDGAICNLAESHSEEILMLKLILDHTQRGEQFYTNMYTHKAEVTHGRFSNLINISQYITDSFVTLVSEAISTTYQPHVTEKFLFPIVARSLWIVNAQPRFHSNIEQYYGFKLFHKIFDYEFDLIENPLRRMIVLLTMLIKFKDLTQDDWKDLYLLEKDTIDFNHEHYYSGDYLQQLKDYKGNNYGKTI